MSFVELAELLSSCEKNSAKFFVIERELKNRLAKDQARINLPNMLWAAALAGVFAIAGAVVGAYLRGLPPMNQSTTIPAQPSIAPAAAPSFRPQALPDIAQPSQGKP